MWWPWKTNRELLEEIAEDVTSTRLIALALERKVRDLMSHFTELIAEVSEMKTVVEGAVATLDRLADAVEEHATEPAVLKQIVADLRADKEKLAAAVASVPPDEPEPTPDPEPA